MDTVLLLDQLAELKAASEVTRLDFDAKRRSILAQVQVELDELDSEYNPLFETVSERIALLESEIKQLVLTGKTSVKGSSLHAVYMSPRVSFDVKQIEGYALAHPEINAMKKLGEPSVQIRNVK